MLLHNLNLYNNSHSFSVSFSPARHILSPFVVVVGRFFISFFFASIFIYNIYISQAHIVCYLPSHSHIHTASCFSSSTTTMIFFSCFTRCCCCSLWWWWFLFRCDSDLYFALYFIRHSGNAKILFFGSHWRNTSQLVSTYRTSGYTWTWKNIKIPFYGCFVILCCGFYIFWEMIKEEVKWRIANIYLLFAYQNFHNKN